MSEMQSISEHAQMSETILVSEHTQKSMIFDEPLVFDNTLNILFLFFVFDATKDLNISRYMIKNMANKYMFKVFCILTSHTTTTCLKC